MANRANTMTAAVAEIEVDKTTGEVTGKESQSGARLRSGLIVNPGWTEKSNRGRNIS